MNSRISNNVINEQLSAFLDGELSPAELPLLLRQIEKQPELLSEAQCLQRARLYSQGEQPVQSLSQADSFYQNLHTAIAQEELYGDSVAAPQAVAVGQAALTQPRQSDIPVAANDSLWKGFAGAGIAAAVAMLAVNLWQSPQLGNSGLEPREFTAATLSAPVTEVAGIQEPAETYTVPKYVAPSQTDSTTYFLEPGDLQTVSLGNRSSGALERFNVDYSDQLLSNRMVILRMHQAESISQQLARENQRLRQQLDNQALVLKANGLLDQ